MEVEEEIERVKGGGKRERKIENYRQG